MSTDHSHASTIIKELGELLKLPDLKLNEHGVAGLIADKKFSVNIEYSPIDSVFHFYSKVMDLSGPIDDALCRKLLSLNAYGNDTAGSTLAWDELHHEIILCRRIEIGIATPTYLKTILESFMDQVERWKSKLSRGLDSIDDEDNDAHTEETDMGHGQQETSFIKG